MYGCIIAPERNRAPFAQSLIVLRPVSYLPFRLTHVVTALTIIKGQIAGLEKGSTDLGNNAPPIAKIEPQQGQTLRIIKGGEGELPQDKESVFYFNFLQIPSNAAISKVVSDGNKLVVTVKHKVKLFYRPLSVVNYKRNWVDDFQIQLIKYHDGIAKIRINNNQPLHVSLSSSIYFEREGKKWATDAFDQQGIKIGMVGQAGQVYARLKETNKEVILRWGMGKECHIRYTPPKSDKVLLLTEQTCMMR
ncbi:fimbria/pilus periplasmic chaperone [Vibrio sp. B1ASS3]|uniref:fimbrial biogenesis chaperone n=1 Tax=Vibrio sp. B1ASS3 TaxID=2751176 RepID=UPI001FC86082|nr:fimbria/pilus periplasmic chaperone [Vibrio sp. B1ASS3]